MAMTANHQPAHFGEPSFVPRMILVFLSLAATLPPSTPTPIPKGFSLEIIHGDSPRSPFYVANLTDVQRLQQSLRLNDCNMGLKDNNDDANDMITSSLFYKSYQYLVNFTLSPGNQSYFITFDTGSELIWTQCKPCNGRPQQVSPPFDMDRSPFYRRLPCSHPNCRRPPFDCTPRNFCNYTMMYNDQTGARGYLSSDYSFINDGMVAIRITFGCTHSLKNWRINDAYPEGILGMSEGPLSFASQLRAIGGINRFSHCLSRSTTHSFLRFGSDILMDRTFQRIPQGYTSGRHYVSDLLDISLDSVRLNIETGAFALNPTLGTEGFFIDSGSSLTKLVSPVYDRVMSVLVAYFKFFHLKRIASPTLDLCYELRDGTEDVRPTMTLHFREADLPLTSENLFIPLLGKFCWAMLQDKKYTILGGYQQRDIRFVFDLEKREMMFAQEDCSVTG